MIIWTIIGGKCPVEFWFQTRIEGINFVAKLKSQMWSAAAHRSGGDTLRPGAGAMSSAMKYGLVGDSSLYTQRNNKKKHLGLCGTKIQVWNWILAKKNGFVPLPKLLRDEWHQSIKAIVQVLQVSTCLATLFFAWAMSVRSFYVYYIYIYVAAAVVLCFMFWFVIICQIIGHDQILWHVRWLSPWPTKRYFS